MTDTSANEPVREIPTLRTERLILRPFGLADAPEVQRLAGAREIADTTETIPHPYEDGVAEAWIPRHAETYAKSEGLTLAITSADGGALLGAISLMQINQDNQRAVLGYWVGHEYWGKGYCTAAAAEIVRFGFEELGLNRVVASHLTRNPASGRVMQKIGMVHEGTFRQDIKKWGKFEDIERYGLLVSEWKDGR